MLHTRKTIQAPLILALAIILVGCSGPTVVVPPTPDIPAVRTEAVQTVVAKLTIEAALNPSPTVAPTQAPLVITATPEPTVEAPQPEPTATAAPATEATATATARPATGGTTGGTSSGGSVVYPTATRRSGPDQAQFISQDPTDGKVFSPGNEFDGTWTFKNIGTSTWTTGYEYRFAKGVNLAKQDRYALRENVPPGGTVTLVTDMVAPDTAGRYVSHWELVNENGDVFAIFYMVIDVR